MTRTIIRLLILAPVAVALTPPAGLFVRSTYASGISASAMDGWKIIVPADAIPSEK